MRKKNMKLRKKTFVYGLVATMMIGLCGCGEKEEKSSDVKYDVTDGAYQEYEYEEGIKDEYICQDANVLAIIFGVADKDRALAALKTLKENLSIFILHINHVIFAYQHH